MKKQIVMLVVGMISSMSAYAQPEQGIGETCSVLAALVSTESGCGDIVKELEISPQVAVKAGTTYSIEVQVVNAANQIDSAFSTPGGYYASSTEIWQVATPIMYRVSGTGDFQVNLIVKDYYTNVQLCSAQQLVNN